jgi:hypothetical protein
MTLTPYEWQRLQYLLGKQQIEHWLLPHEEQELRGLVAKQGFQDANKLNVGGLAALGLGIVAAWLLLRDKR